MSDQKATNPKDTIGCTKVPLDRIPLIAEAEESLAYHEGATKYGANNWCCSGVRASIYIAACMRHLKKWQASQERDPATQVHHLGNARACLGILLDAQIRGKLEDDRPPFSQAAIDAIDALSGNITHLNNLFKDHNPRHYTVADSEECNNE